jgi:hypothetical protein
MTSKNKFLHLITVAGRKRAGNKSNTKVFTLQTAEGEILNTEERFFRAVNQSLPLNPPRVFHNWDALEDSLFGGLLYSGHKHVEIIWPFADDVAASSTHLMIKIVKFFHSVAKSIYDEDDPQRNCMLSLNLVCSNERSKKRLKLELWAWFILEPKYVNN